MTKLQRALSSFLKSVVQVITKIVRAPVEIVLNISRILKFSMRSKITMTYLILYTWITIFTGVFILFGTLYFNINHFDSNKGVYITAIENIIENSNGDSRKIQDSLSAIELDEVEVMVQSLSKETLAVSHDTFPIMNYEAIKNSSSIYKTIPSISLLRYFLIPRATLYNDYYIVLFYDVTEYVESISLVLLILFMAYLFGVLFMWLFGSGKIKRVLGPIKQFTRTAQNINEKNLDIRIDVGEAKYELKDLAVTINGMMDRIESSYTKQQQFVSDVSHELRTPISVINGYANMLDRWGKDNPEVLQESIDALKNEAGNMGQLVEQLLFLARFDVDRVKYEIEDIDLGEIVEDIANETEMIDSKHRIIRNISKPLNIQGDHNRIKQVIRIFLDNAIKYTLDGGNIFIKAYEEDNMAIVSIKDTGIGISKKDLEGIFDRFYRADKSRTKNTGGYGLGLSIAKIIVLRHKGKIIVRSKPDAGSEFKIIIPLR